MISIVEQVYFSSFGRGFGGDDDSSLICMYIEGKGKFGFVKGIVEMQEVKFKLVIDLFWGIYLCFVVEIFVFVKYVGFDFDQVYDFCINVVGGSKMLFVVGQEIIQVFCDGKKGWVVKDESSSLKVVVVDFEVVVLEVQVFKVLIYLGNQVLNLMCFVMRYGGGGLGVVGSVVNVWVS